MPKTLTILDHEVDHVLATIEMLEYEISDGEGVLESVAEDMVEEAKQILNECRDRERQISEIIKEYGEAADARKEKGSDKPKS